MRAEYIDGVGVCRRTWEDRPVVEKGVALGV